MIDIHSHILPGIDDGAKTENDSMNMARAAVEQGIDTIIATPHHRNEKYVNARESILMQVDILNELFESNDIPLTVLPGQETRINGDMITEIEEGIIQSLNDTKYVFVEFPSNHVPRYSEKMLFDIQVAGRIPVIVHPERNRELIEHPDKLYDFVKNGALTQITAASFTGRFGKTIQKFTNQIMDASLAHFLASDAHNTTTRGFCMLEAYNEIQEQYGYDMHYTLMENAQLLVQGENVSKFEPERIKKKKFLGIF